MLIGISGDQFLFGADFQFKVLAVGFVVIGAAEVLEKTYGFNWWLTAAATAMIVAPIWWLYLRRSKNGRQEQRRWDATE